VSEGVREVLLRSGLPPDLLHVVRSGVDPAGLVPARPRAETRRALGVAPEELLVGGIGALAPHKDHRTWIEAAAMVASRIPRARFLLAGEGELRGDLERRREALGLGERVRLLGFREDVPDLLGAFDVLLHSSRLEGLGTSLVDAAFAGLPIVATRTGGIPEIARHGENAALAPAGDARSLAAALESVLEDPARRERMGSASRRIALEFHADRTAAETLRIYERLLPG
jgi:glycosyltransferase involved in cell wall biosynthesis